MLFRSTKASLRAILKHPTAIVFSLGFPLIFLWIFGSFGQGGTSKYKLALAKNSDTANNALLDSIKKHPMLDVVYYKDSNELKIDLEKGRIVGLIDVQKIAITDSLSKNYNYLVFLNSTTASVQDFGVVFPILNNIKNKFDIQHNPNFKSYVNIIPKVETIREYKIGRAHV